MKNTFHHSSQEKQTGHIAFNRRQHFVAGMAFAAIAWLLGHVPAAVSSTLPLVPVTDCDIAVAVDRARQVSDHIMKVNGDGTLKAAFFMQKTEDDLTYYYITNAYDEGLSVPAYRVKLTKSSCSVLDIEYQNWEG